MLEVVSLFFGGAMGKLWAFLKSLSFWQIVSLGLAVYCGLQFFELKHTRAEAARWEKQFESEHSGRIADRKAYQQAQAEAAVLALKQKQDTEARYAALATQKDQEYEIGLQNGRDAALRYIATHGLQPSTSGPPSGPSATAKDNGSDLSQGLPPDPVVVSAGDVQACTAATAYAIAAHDWALSLTNTGAAAK